MNTEKWKEKWEAARPFIKKYLKYLLTCLIFGVLLTFCGDHSLINYFHRNRKIKQQEKELKQYQLETEKDKQSIENLKKDRDNLERFARENYYMKAPGEDIYLVEEE